MSLTTNLNMQIRTRVNPKYENIQIGEDKRLKLLHHNISFMIVTQTIDKIINIYNLLTVTIRIK